MASAAADNNQQGQLTRGLPILLSTLTETSGFPSNLDPNGIPSCIGHTGNQQPHVIMSPLTGTNLPTTGLLVAFQQGNVTFISPTNFQVWLRNPGSYVWSKFTLLTNVQFGQWYITNDLDVSELYFELTTGTTVDGTFAVECMEI